VWNSPCYCLEVNIAQHTSASEVFSWPLTSASRRGRIRVIWGKGITLTHTQHHQCFHRWLVKLPRFINSPGSPSFLPFDAPLHCSPSLHASLSQSLMMYRVSFRLFPVSVHLCADSLSPQDREKYQPSYKTTVLTEVSYQKTKLATKNVHFSCKENGSIFILLLKEQKEKKHHEEDCPKRLLSFVFFTKAASELPYYVVCVFVIKKKSY